MSVVVCSAGTRYASPAKSTSDYLQFASAHVDMLWSDSMLVSALLSMPCWAVQSAVDDPMHPLSDLGWSASCVDVSALFIYTHACAHTESARPSCAGTQPHIMAMDFDAYWLLWCARPNVLFDARHARTLTIHGNASAHCVVDSDEYRCICHS
jgi:hypothetical protein